MSFVTIFRSAFIFLCILFSLLGYTIYQLNVSIERKDTALKHQEEFRLLGEQLAKGSGYLTAEVRSYVQFGAIIHYDNFWLEVDKTRSRDIAVERLKKLKVLPKELDFIEIAKWYSDKLISTEQMAMEYMKGGNSKAARKLVFGDYYLEQKKLIMGNVNKFQGLINKRAAKETKKAESKAELLIDITNILLILSGLLVLFFFYFIGIKQLVEPMKSLTSSMLKLALGNLDVTIPKFPQKNEIGDMASTLEVFKSNLMKRHDNERLLNTVVNNTTSVIYVKDLEGRYLFINKSFQESLSLGNQQVLGKNDYDLVSEELAGKFTRIDNEVIRLGIPFKGEEIAQHDDGIHTYISTKVPLLNSKEEIYGLCGISTDITELVKSRAEKKDTEKRIDKERKKFFNMLDQLPVSFHLQASDYTVPFANQMFRDRFGDPETGKCYKLMHNRKIPCEPCPTFKIFDSLKTESSKWTSKDDKTYLSVVTPFDDLNGDKLLMEMSIDITNEENSRKSQIQSEKRFRTIFEESPLGVALIDSLTGNIYEVNPKYSEIVGRSSDEMEKINWMSITHPDDIQEDLDNMAAMNAGKINGFNMEKRIKKPDNTNVWINLTIAPIKVDNKSYPLHLAMIQDIDERKRNEALVNFQNDILEIVAQEVPLNKILEEIVLGLEKISTGIIASILLLDKTGKHLRYGAAPNLPKPYIEATDGLSIGPSVGSFGTAAYRKETVIVEDIASDPLWADYKQIAHSNGLRSCWSVPIFSMKNNLLGTLAFYSKEKKRPSHLDFSLMKIANLAGIAIEKSNTKEELNQYQNKLTELVVEKTKEVEGGEQRFQSYFDLPLVGFAITSPEKWWLDVNQYLCNMLGYSLKELKQMTWVDITHPEDLGAETFQFSRMLDGEIEKYSLEKRFVKKNGTNIHILLSVACVRSENLKVETVFAVMQDISTRKLAEKQLKESQSRTIHSDNLVSLGKLVGSVAHEFNNPIFGLINLTERLGKDLKEEERRKFSEIAQKECWRMSDMIKNLQSFYKPSELIFFPTEIDVVIEGVLLIVAKAYEIKGIQVNKIYNTDIFSFEAIEDQITQIILNVLKNSIDSISEDEGKITLTLDRTNSNLILKIQDTGKGIKKEDLKLIFDPFFTTKGKDGTGLGLSVSYGLVKSHGGHISAESKLGVGSTVTLTLPISRKI